MSACQAFGWDRELVIDGQPCYQLDLMLGGLKKIYGRLREAGFLWHEDEDVAVREAELSRERELKKALKESSKPAKPAKKRKAVKMEELEDEEAEEDY